MRWSLVLLLGLTVGGGLWLLFGRDAAAPPGGPATAGSDDEEQSVPAYLRLKSGTLTLRVVATDGTVPALAQAGYETPQGNRLYMMDDEGKKTLTDAPLGNLVILAKAPGFADARRAARIEAGVAEEVAILMTRLPAGSTEPGK